MKKLLLLILVVVLGWKYYLDDAQRQQVKDWMQPNKLNEVISTKSGEPRFSCDTRKFCNQMNSLAEAEYFLQNCGATELDENMNGIPCETDPRFFSENN